MSRTNSFLNCATDAALLAEFGQVIIRHVYLSGFTGCDNPAEQAQRAFRRALNLGLDVRCTVCGRRIPSIVGAFFLLMTHPTHGEIVAMACSEICLRRSLKHGVE